ncbi:hypothetical protein [Glutamicibacter sp.]|jgi:hypothetical protein|uniref:hypothetical protein n=1 Tax=Glutamicibacter sp. TaxID=1931995 RepID=UPI002B46F417|nr:hypothetical protein [Glutamicibacter sp.]HJX79164.1 hypothetical protein [Glutamicibacter sp.]
MRTKNKNDNKIFNTKELKKNWETNVIISLIVVSSFATGMYFSNLNFTNQLNKDKISADTVTTTLDERSASIMSDLMDQTVSSCYYDLYLDPDKANGTTTTSGDICNNAVMFYQEFCKWASLDSCNSDYFKKYIKGMEG